MPGSDMPLLGAIAVKPWPGRSGATTVKWRASSGARSRHECVDAPVPCRSSRAGHFYVGGEELGHIHLDGEAHLAVTRAMRDVAIRAGTGHAAPWPGYENWLHIGITEDTAAEALALFRANHARLSSRQTATLDRKPT